MKPHGTRHHICRVSNLLIFLSPAERKTWRRDLDGQPLSDIYLPHSAEPALVATGGAR